MPFCLLPPLRFFLLSLSCSISLPATLVFSLLFSISRSFPPSPRFNGDVEAFEDGEGEEEEEWGIGLGREEGVSLKPPPQPPPRPPPQSPKLLSSSWLFLRLGCLPFFSLHYFPSARSLFLIPGSHYLREPPSPPPFLARSELQVREGPPERGGWLGYLKASSSFSSMLAPHTYSAEGTDQLLLSPFFGSSLSPLLPCPLLLLLLLPRGLMAKGASAVRRKARDLLCSLPFYTTC